MPADAPTPQVRELPAHSIGGGLALLLGLLGLVAGVGLIVAGAAVAAARRAGSPR